MTRDSGSRSKREDKRSLAEAVGRQSGGAAASPRIPKLERITIFPVELNPEAWGFSSREEMEKAFALSPQDTGGGI